MVHRAEDGASSAVAWGTGQTELRKLSYETTDSELYAVSFWMNPHDRFAGSARTASPVIRIGSTGK
jgi:hypothetical protein